MFREGRETTRSIFKCIESNERLLQNERDFYEYHAYSPRYSDGLNSDEQKGNIKSVKHLFTLSVVVFIEMDIIIH